MKISEIEKRQYTRFVILLEAYKEGKCDTEKIIDLAELCHPKGIKNGVFKCEFDYLVAEEFLKKNQTGTHGYASITHKGIKIVEYVITHGDERTEQFSAYKDMGI